MASTDGAHSWPAAGGVIVVDKPAGVTSFDVVQEVRRRLHLRKVGHTGTLDPMATGVLPICVGEATKIAGLLTVGDKEYRGTGQLGLETDTLDITGTVTARCEAQHVERGELERVLSGLVGPQLQVPPAYSAVRSGGVRAYQRARRGEEVQLEPRPIDVKRLDLLGWDPPCFDLHLVCSKGTYVRVLVAEAGRQLGCGAVLVRLQRVRAGPFVLAAAVPLSDVELGRLVGVDEALGHLPALDVSEADAARLRQGQAVAVSGPSCDTLIRLRSQGKLVALGETRGELVCPRRVFVEEHVAAGG